MAARRPLPCKTEGCDEPRVRGAVMCAKHLGDRRRCIGRVKEYADDGVTILSERQCKRTAMPGLDVCSSHGGSAPKLRQISQRTEALTAMQRFVQPYQGDINAVTAFEMEYRRTYGRIMWLEERIANLEDEHALIWGMTKEEDVSATEFAGTNRTYEARIHTFEEMLRWERKHFLELTKLWVRAGLEERKLTVVREYINFTFAKVNEAAQALGHDPNDPQVHDLLMRLFTHDEPQQIG